MSFLTTLQLDTEYKNVISELKLKIENLETTNEQRWTQIEKLEEEIAEAGTLCKKLTDEKNEIQWEYDKLKLKEYNQSYTIENQKKIIGDVNKTLKRFVKENKAFRELVSLWI